MSELSVVLHALVSVFTTLGMFGVQSLYNKKKFRQERRLSIFRMLMKHRNNHYHYEFAEALNLIEVEFSDKKEIILARRELQKTLYRTYIKSEDQERDIERDLLDLIVCVADSVNIKISASNILHGAYIAQKNIDDEYLDNKSKRTRCIRLARELIEDGFEDDSISYYTGLTLNEIKDLRSKK